MSNSDKRSTSKPPRDVARILSLELKPQSYFFLTFPPYPPPSLTPPLSFSSQFPLFLYPSFRGFLTKIQLGDLGNTTICLVVCVMSVAKPQSLPILILGNYEPERTHSESEASYREIKLCMNKFFPISQCLATSLKAPKGIRQ